MAQSKATDHDLKTNGVDKTSEQIKAKAAEATDHIREKAEALGASMGKAAEHSVDYARDTAKIAKDHAIATGGKARDAVRRNPELAIAGALGVGVLLGLALSRRS